MKINEAAKDFFILTLDREELEFVAAMMEDHAVDIAVKLQVGSGQDPVVDRCWKMSVQMDSALWISIGDEDED